MSLGGWESPLTRRWPPASSARRGTYRIIYLLDEDAHVVEVTAIRHRSDAYRR
jgi:mRNA-degrading endonuclease RelE of RelBE toxin-antitoxin system